MAAFYDARGNTYFVASPEEIGGFADIARTAPEAARTRDRWARRAIERICGRLNVPAELAASGAKRYRSDGLLVGPFQDANAFALLIVNTDGTLAERSGNGLTIFSQSLVDSGRANRADAFLLRVYHDAPGSPFVEARIEADEREGHQGFWIDMGVPTYGIAAVGATPEYVGISEFENHRVARVFDLEKIEASWACSQFVNVGNPHCVTFLKSPDLLPTTEQLGSDAWMPGLSAIANSTESDGIRGAGRPCRNGINLQWACVTGPACIDARVFERGEGPTLSSGSSATAVASAARKLGLVDAQSVDVRMPGGIAPVRFDERDGRLARVMLFGEAQQAQPPA
ncbi:MAG: diaminopimelate epimerase [Betaproteobacteria bacterium]|nr:MAG: diaminopimelate epimerase [Betaproteobacteria bacterium]